jgi:hypothetical protein
MLWIDIFYLSRSVDISEQKNSGRSGVLIKCKASAAFFLHVSEDIAHRLGVGPADDLAASTILINETSRRQRAEMMAKRRRRYVEQALDGADVCPLGSRADKDLEDTQARAVA